MNVKLVWITPDADDMVAYLARVSNPKAQPGDPSARLIQYLIRHKHWSPFEMASACFEIETTRDIARQILRHRSFSFQEFSQRYAEVDGDGVFREARMQDTTNRQKSLPCTDDGIADDWACGQRHVWAAAVEEYQNALRRGIAKEVARAVLPEGFTPTRMFVSGTIRSWIHYLEVRTDEGTQKEHREIAQEIDRQLLVKMPATWLALQFREGQLAVEKSLVSSLKGP